MSNSTNWLCSTKEKLCRKIFVAFCLPLKGPGLLEIIFLGEGSSCLQDVMADYVLPKICRCAVQFLWNYCLQSEVFQCCHGQPLSQFHCLLLYATWSEHAGSTLISLNIHTSNRTYCMVHKYFSLTCLTLFYQSNF